MEEVRGNYLVKGRSSASLSFEKIFAEEGGNLPRERCEKRALCLLYNNYKTRQKQSKLWWYRMEGDKEITRRMEGRGGRRKTLRR